MKKKDLIQLLENLDDDQEIYGMYHDSEDEVHRLAKDFKLTKWHRDFIKTRVDEHIFVLSVDRASYLYGYLDEKEYNKKLQTNSLIQSFPHKNSPSSPWEIKESSLGGVEVLFCIGQFKYHFAVKPLTKTQEFHILHFGRDMNHVPFTTWENFFQSAKPLILKSLQKYREELECFESDSI